MSARTPTDIVLDRLVEYAGGVRFVDQVQIRAALEGPEFDAWLAGVKATAWDEGYEDAFDRAMDDDWPMVRPNPYRSEA